MWQNRLRPHELAKGKAGRFFQKWRSPDRASSNTTSRCLAFEMKTSSGRHRWMHSEQRWFPVDSGEGKAQSGHRLGRQSFGNRRNSAWLMELITQDTHCESLCKTLSQFHKKFPGCFPTEFLLQLLICLSSQANMCAGFFSVCVNEPGNTRVSLVCVSSWCSLVLLPALYMDQYFPLVFFCIWYDGLLCLWIFFQFEECDLFASQTWLSTLHKTFVG